VDENRGKVTVINFWGTWCGPCIAELPHFEQVAKDYADTVTVVAVHSNYRGNTAAEWISQNYPDTAILFAQDPDDGANGAYYTALGGEGDFPMTFVVDADGVLTFVCRGSVTHDELVAAVEEALAK
jgi:thiol-disulfide isomerase/thioredoxin